MWQKRSQLLLVIAFAALQAQALGKYISSFVLVFSSSSLKIALLQ